MPMDTKPFTPQNSRLSIKFLFAKEYHVSPISSDSLILARVIVPEAKLTEGRFRRCGTLEIDRIGPAT